MRRSDTTISCRAFALTALLIAVGALPAIAGDRRPLPGLPLAQWWSVPLDGAVTSGPVGEGPRIYVALASAHLTARAAADGHELWRHARKVDAPMAAAGDLLFVAAGDAIEGLRGDTGQTVWTLPRTSPVAPLVASGDWLIAATSTDVIAIRAATGEVVWRQPAGGVKLPPALDADRVYTGADDGRVLALSLKDGSVVWEKFFTGGVTAIAARAGRAYVGAGDKSLHCLDAAKTGEEKWDFPLGAYAVGRMVVDDDRVYVAALNNLIRALDRRSGNQRWQIGLRRRPSFGVLVAEHVVFVPTLSADLPLVYAHDGLPSGALALPDEVPPGLTPSVIETRDGTVVYTVTGGLANQWSLTKFARAGEAALVPVGSLAALPGVPYLTDPILAPIGKVLGLLILGDPPLTSIAVMGWPLVLRDPPLAPFTTMPGVQLRPLSPVLPARPGGRGPGG